MSMRTSLIASYLHAPALAVLLQLLVCALTPDSAEAAEPGGAAPANPSTREAPATEPNKAFEEALVVAIHHFVQEGELDHLRAILDRYPQLVDRTIAWTPQRTPSRHYSLTPLHRAVERERKDVALYLIGKGANVNQDTGGGWRVLHSAAQVGDLDIVKALVKAGAKIDAKTEAQPETFQLLPNPAPADVNRRVRLPAIPSRTPLEIAEKEKHPAVAKYLREAGK